MRRKLRVRVRIHCLSYLCIIFLHFFLAVGREVEAQFDVIRKKTEQHQYNNLDGLSQDMAQLLTVFKREEQLNSHKQAFTVSLPVLVG